MSEILRSRHECAYCGWTGNTQDHIPAISSYWLGNNRLRHRQVATNEKNSIPACSECNQTLGNLHLISIRERADYLIDRYEKKYKKLLNQPVWSSEEMKKLGPGMRNYVKAKATEKQMLLERLAHLGTISRFGSDTLKEYWSKVEG